MKLMLLVRSLNTGGTERQIISLAKGLNKKGNDITVSVFYPNGTLESELTGTGMKILSLGKKSRWDVFGFTFRLFRALKNEKPDVVYSFLVVPNLFLGIMKLFFPGIKMVWGVRASNVDFNQYDWLSRVTFKVSCWLSRFADLIIVNSNSGLEYHAVKGYPKNKMVVIPNGIDTDRFHPNSTARQIIRDEWGIAKDETLIGLVGRLDSMKDHKNFLRAASILLKRNNRSRFICVGEGPSQYKKELKDFCESLLLTHHVIWEGVRTDMCDVYNALDIVTLSSLSEGFPNVLGEAMACGIPCVATDAGDSEWILGNAGVVVPVKNPDALAEGWIVCLKDKTDKSLNGRLHIMENFSVNHLIQKTNDVICPNK